MAENMSEHSGEGLQQQGYETPPEQPPEVGQERATERAIEQRQVSEGAPSKQPPPLPVQQQAAPIQAVPADQQAPAVSDNGSSALSAGLPANDVDLIEKQWVERAKSIVAHNQDDPYKQKNEMSKFKADYIKKRFNKTIPVDDKSTP